MIQTIKIKNNILWTYYLIFSMIQL